MDNIINGISFTNLSSYIYKHKIVQFYSTVTTIINLHNGRVRCYIYTLSLMDFVQPINFRIHYVVIDLLCVFMCLPLGVHNNTPV